MVGTASSRVFNAKATVPAGCPAPLAATGALEPPYLADPPPAGSPSPEPNYVGPPASCPSPPPEPVTRDISTELQPTRAEAEARAG